MKTNNPLRLFSRALLKPFFAIAAIAVPFIVPGTADGQIFVAGGKGNDTVGKYNLDGTTVSASLIPTGLNDPSDIALSESNLFVMNFNSHILGKYNFDGTPVNTSLISGLPNPGGIAVSGSHLFILTGSTIREYTTDGALVNASLITGLSAPLGFEVSGSNLFVVTRNNTIAQYTTSGTLVNPSLITGLTDFSSIAVSGTDLFIASFELGMIGHYTIAGETVNASLVSGLNFPIDIEVLGSNLFVLNNGSHTIGEYTTSGEAVNTSLVTGLRESTRGIAVVPEPSAWAFVLAGSGVLLMFRARYRTRSRKERSKASTFTILTMSFVLPFANPEKVRAQAIRTDAAYTSTTAPMVRAGYATYDPQGPWDDGSAGGTYLGFSITFLGQSTSLININNNGNITFTDPFYQYTPDPNPFTETNNVGKIIGPFFADVDTRPAHQGPSTNPEDDRLVTYGNSSVNYGGMIGNRDSFGINWVNVGYYSNKTDKLNAFQLIIIDRSDTGTGIFDFEFNYDQIHWETGDRSGGSGGFGGYPARVGWSNDAGISY